MLARLRDAFGDCRAPTYAPTEHPYARTSTTRNPHPYTRQQTYKTRNFMATTTPAGVRGGHAKHGAAPPPPSAARR